MKYLVNILDPKCHLVVNFQLTIQKESKFEVETYLQSHPVWSESDYEILDFPTES